MLLILSFLLFFLFSPHTAWAYFDPGFGGYLVNSVISLIVTASAFVCAAFIYFFRTVIGRNIIFIWQKHQQLALNILLSILYLGSFTLGAFLFCLCHRSFFFVLLQMWSYVDTGFGKFFGFFIIILSFIACAFICVILIYWKKYRKFHNTIFLSILCLVYAFLGASIFNVLSKTLTAHDPLTGVKIIEPPLSFRGYDLYDGELIDEKGAVVKKWSHDYLGTIDKNGDYYGEKRNGNQRPTWGRYSWNDHAIWEKHLLIHHELYLSPNNTIFTFSQEVHNYNHYKVDFDIILEFDKNGRELQRYSLWDHLNDFKPYHAEFGIDASFFPGLPLLLLWQNYFEGTYDYFHINSFYMIPPNPLENKDPAFRRGNWLISIFHGSMVFILDRDTKKILWHAVAGEVEGKLEGQHSASMLSNGDILLFDNGINRKASRILIIDPLTLKINWEYQGPHFFTPIEGYVQSLPNGNCLVTESKKGHVFELTRDKKIVWEYYDTVNDQGDIYRMTRYPQDMIDRILKKNNEN